jgi:dihydrodipicolinate synthase/N-acetylneuraminate lyase
MPSGDALRILRKGAVIPASPLALDEKNGIDERRETALMRYYVAAGAGGVAVGVHTTQFEIRNEEFGLFEPVLALASEKIDEAARKAGRTVVKVAGVCGETAQAVKEAETAASLGYDVGLLNLSALRGASDDELIEHCRAVGEAVPLMGFYLQPAVGGRVLPYSFWRSFAEIDNAVAIKIAPFDRYETFDVVRAVADAGREDDIILYTGNDDAIILDLLTPFRVVSETGEKVLRIRGGLLGQWAVWTKRAVEILDEIHDTIEKGGELPFAMLEKNAALTDANAAVFDAANNFKGCIPGIHEVLRRQGLFEHIRCLDSSLGLSPGQSEELDRVIRSYPWLTDDGFVRECLDEWLS